MDDISYTIYKKISGPSCSGKIGNMIDFSVETLSIGYHLKKGYSNSIGLDIVLSEANASVGPIDFTVGLDLSSRLAAGVEGFELKILGIGLKWVSLPVCAVKFKTKDVFRFSKKLYDFILVIKNRGLDYILNRNN